MNLGEDQMKTPILLDHLTWNDPYAKDFKQYNRWIVQYHHC